MKKIILLVVAIVVAVALTYQTDVGKLLPSGAKTCEFYIAGEVDEIRDVKMVKVGDMTIASSNFKNYSIVSKQLGNILGVAVRYDKGTVSVDDILRETSAKLVKVEQSENYVCYYAHSNLLKKSVNVDDKDINLQIAITQNGIIVGSPMIMGSY